MAYMHIDNLYKNQDILLFRECYAMEKIHGTSAHVGWKGGQVRFFAGGVDHENFVNLFSESSLSEKFQGLGHPIVTVYGEAYGGKCQGMKDTYGINLKFIAFEVKIGDLWLVVPQAEDVARKIGFEFVYYHKISTDLAVINQERDADSVQAVRNGLGEGKMREGVVLRPLIEVFKNNGERIIAKHKRDEFKETATPRDVDPDKLQILQDAQSVADEWVTPMRLSHILQGFQNAGIEQTGAVIKAMVEDVMREGDKEITDSKDVRRAIGKKVVEMFKEYLQGGLTG